MTLSLEAHDGFSMMAQLLNAQMICQGVQFVKVLPHTWNGGAENESWNVASATFQETCHGLVVKSFYAFYRLCPCPLRLAFQTRGLSHDPCCYDAFLVHLPDPCCHLCCVPSHGCVPCRDSWSSPCPYACPSRDGSSQNACPLWKKCAFFQRRVSDFSLCPCTFICPAQSAA